MNKVVLLSVTALLATIATAAFVAPSIAISNQSTTFGTTYGSTDTITYDLTVAVTPTYNYRAFVPSFTYQFLDSGGAVVAQGMPTFIPSQFVATCTAITDGVYPITFTFDGHTYMYTGYSALPAKLKARVVSGRYRYDFGEALGMSGCPAGSFPATDNYTTPWSTAVSLP